MVGKIKKWLTVGCLSILCFTTGAFAVSCANNLGEENQSKVEYVLTLKEGTKTISIGESIALEVQSYNGQRTVEWSTSNNAIATVQDGVITGVSVGTAIITASAGSAKDTCMVFVKEQAEKDDALSIELTLEKSILYIEEETVLCAQLKQGTTTVSGASYEYTVSDSSVVEISENGEIKAKAEGNATVTAFTTWENKLYSKAISITVKPDYEVVLDKKSVEIYAISQWKDDSYKNTELLTASVLYRGTPTNETVLWTTADSSVATVENGLIKGETVGVASVQASYTKDGRTYQDKAFVNVQAAKVGLLTTTAYDVSVEQQYAFADIEGYADILGEVKNAYIAINGMQYPIATGEESFFTIPERFSGKNVEIALETNQFSVSFLVNAYISINTYEDLTMLYEKSGGYYKLTQDLDLTDKEWNYPQKNTFSGIFDGDGYEIIGLSLTGAHGLFYEIENDVEIKDLALTNVRIDTKETVGALFANDKNEGTKLTVENVTANVSICDGGASGGLFGSVLGSVSLKNISVYTYQPSHDGAHNGAIFASLTGKLTAEGVKIYSALQYVSSNTQLEAVVGVTHILPTVFKEDGKEVRLDFLSEGESYNLQDNTLLIIEETNVYYPSAMQTVVAEFAIDGSFLMQAGGKNIELVAKVGEEFLYYCIPVSEKGYLNQDNFYKLPWVTSGEVFLEEDIDFSKVTKWQDLKSVKFTGVFDGQNHKISNFNERMFGEFCGVAKNFDLVDATVKNAAGYGLVADLMRAGSKLENVSIFAKVGHYEKCGVLARYITDNVNLTNVSIVAFSTRTSDVGFIGGFGTKGASVNCKDCLFVVNNVNDSFAPLGIRDGSFINTFEEMGENYGAVLRGTFVLYNSPLEFIKAYENNTLSESHKTIYQEKFQTVLAKEVKEIKTTADLTEMLNGNATYYYLTEDIDCTNLDWSTIERDTTTYFQIILEGNERCINALPDYLFYNFQGRLQNVAFTHMQAGASICKIARGGALSNVFLHGEVARDTDGGLFALEINAYKGSGLYYLLFDNVTVVTTNTPQFAYKQGFVAGFATVRNTVECKNSVFISKYLPIELRGDKDNKGNHLYVYNFGNNYNGFLNGTYVRYTSANQLDAEYQGVMTPLNQKYYVLTKVLEEEGELDTGNDGDALVRDSVWS